MTNPMAACRSIPAMPSTRWLGGVQAGHDLLGMVEETLG